VLLRALKLGGPFPGLSEPFLEPLRQQVERPPFWIAPFPHDQQYGLVLSERRITLTTETEMEMAEAICRLKSPERTEEAKA